MLASHGGGWLPLEEGESSSSRSACTLRSAGSPPAPRRRCGWRRGSATSGDQARRAGDRRPRWPRRHRLDWRPQGGARGLCRNAGAARGGRPRGLMQGCWYSHAGRCGRVMIGMRDDPSSGRCSVSARRTPPRGARDVAFRVSPLTDLDARGMVHEVRATPCSRLPRPPARRPRGARGGVAQAVAPGRGGAGDREVDLNPVFALPPGSGYRIVGARVRVHEPER